MTPSNKTLFGEPGRFYVFKSYGIHYCLNVVTDKKNFASGVLIRAVSISDRDERFAAGPGLVSKAYGIDSSFDSLKVSDNSILWITKGQFINKETDLIQTTRIGITKAKNIKWRWYLKRSGSVSKRVKGDRKPRFKNSNNQLSTIS